MDTTVNLELPFLMPSQAQKHVTHNEALLALDVLTQIALKSRSVATPPVSPVAGDRYLVAAEGDGAWSGMDGRIASFTDGAWRFHAAKAGFVAWIVDEGKLTVHDGEAFADVPVTLPTLAPLLGLNTTADTTNRLAVASPASLFTHEGSDHRLSLNKAAPADTASLLFSTAYAAHAEIGLTGSNNFSVKVSADGTAFTESLTIDAATGTVEFHRNLFADGAVASIMRDGGRFSGSPEPSGTTVGAFSTPGWVALTNGATLADHGKFVRDSATYGGTGAALDPDIEALMTTLIDAAFRRYYPEFHVAKLTAGTATGSAVVFLDAVTRYSQLYTQPLPRPVKLTTSYYLKVLSGDAGIPWNVTRRLFIDGTECFASAIIPADNAWHHVLTLEGQDFTKHYRYSYDAIRLYQRPGDVALIAFPAAVPGQVLLPVNIGQVPGTGLW
jgi:hypothetical protein